MFIRDFGIIDDPYDTESTSAQHFFLADIPVWPACWQKRRIPGLLWEGLVANLRVVAISLHLHNGAWRAVLAEMDLPAL